MFTKFLNHRFYKRFSRWILAVALLSLPAVGYGIHGALQGGDNDVRQWLPDGFRETREYDAFLERFGSEEMAVVSWPGCATDDPRLDRFAAELAPLVAEASGVTHAVDSDKPLKRVLTTNQAIAELANESLGVTRDEALRRLGGLLVGTDGKTAAAIVMVNDAGVADRRGALEKVRAAAERAGVPRAELKMAGPTVDSVSLETESQRSRYLLAGISVVVALALAWRSLRNARLAVMVFATALYCAGVNVALVYVFGGTMNLLLGMMPTLLYVLALSGSVHFVNYYRDAIRDRGASGAPLRAVKAAWMPSLLSAATTAVGLGSLAFSQVIPVRMFGLYSALGVATGLPLLYLLLPSMLQLWPVTNGAETRDAMSAAAAAKRSGAKLIDWVIPRRSWIYGIGAAVMLLGAWGVARLDTSVKLLNLFSPKSQIIADYTWLEKHLGPMVPVEIVVHFEKSDRRTVLDRLELASRIERRLNDMEHVGGTMSAATFAPPLPEKGGVSGTTRRVVFERRLEKQRDYFADTRYVRDTAEGELWRVSARVEALNSLDYGQFVNDLRGAVEPILRDSETVGAAPVQASYTGIVPLIYKAQRTLLDDLLSSFIGAFFIVGIMMMVLLRSVPAGLISMIPNLFPAIVLFGAMGLSGMPCDIGSMMTAGAAIGIAVDDTIHFLTWFRRASVDGASRDTAIRRAYRHCAPAMIQTSIVCGLGLLVFAMSSFVPTSHFAWLMAGMLGLGLVGDLILLPALLAGPLGRYFKSTDGSAQPVPAADQAPLAGFRLASAH